MIAMGKFSIYHRGKLGNNMSRSKTVAPGSAEVAPLDEKVLEAALQIMRPLARLLVANGLKFGQAEEVLKHAFVDAGRRALEQAGATPNVSRVSVSTGIHRKDVKRLLEFGDGGGDDALAHGRSFASELYTRWTADPAFRRRGRVLDLPMRAPRGQPSFELLARGVSTDVHPRALLEELRRLGLVEVDADDGRVRLVEGGFVPSAERRQVMALLADNVADHLAGAVGNVGGESPAWLEQAVFADGLSIESLAEVDAQARRLWQQAMRALVPLLRERIGVDAAGPRDRRVRVGMYVYGAPAPAAAPARGQSDVKES